MVALSLQQERGMHKSTGLFVAGASRRNSVAEILYGVGCIAEVDCSNPAQ